MKIADKIRAMSDEELAEWLAPRMLCRDCPKCGKVVRGYA